MRTLEQRIEAYETLLRHEPLGNKTHAMQIVGIKRNAEGEFVSTARTQAEWMEFIADRAQYVGKTQLEVFLSLRMNILNDIEYREMIDMGFESVDCAYGDCGFSANAFVAGFVPLCGMHHSWFLEAWI